MIAVMPVVLNWKNYIVVAALPLLAACNDSISSQALRVWHIEYRVSGGLIGKMQGLDLAANGRGVVFDQRRGIRQDFIAPTSQVHTLSTEIDRLKNDPAPHRRKTGTGRKCADCITQHVRISFEQGDLAFNNRMGVAATPENTVIFKTLSQMLAHALTGAMSNSTTR